MQLVLKFKQDEEIYINGAHIIVTRGTVIKIETKDTVILREKYLMKETDFSLSPVHSLAYAWFRHHTKQQIMSDEECDAVAEQCIKFVPTLAPIAKRKAWLQFYIELRKLL